MNAPVAHPQIAAFVEQVRAELDDLSPEEVDELTEGLEADLSDAQNDAGVTDGEALPDPVVYAAELRSAAGLPPRTVLGAALGGEQLPVTVRLRRRYRDAAATVRSQGWWPAVGDFLVTLRPIWWMLRALVAAAGLGIVFGLASWPLAVVLVIISIEIGRRKVVERAPGWRSLIAVANAVAALGLLLVVSVLLRAGGGPARMFDVLDGPTPAEVTAVEPAQQDGIWADGREVHNIYPYDSAGRPLSGVQLYDEAGQPVAIGRVAQEETSVVEGDGTPTLVTLVPAVDRDGQPRWNVFPLRRRTDVENGPDSTTTGTPMPPPWPRIAPGPVLVPQPAGSATVTPSGPAAPGASGSAASTSAASGSAASTSAVSTSAVSTSAPVTASPSRAG